MRDKESAALLAQLGARLAAVRKARGLTQEQLAEALDVSPGYLRRVEAGRENLTVETIAKVSRGLGVPLADLLKVPK